MVKKEKPKEPVKKNGKQDKDTEKNKKTEPDAKEDDKDTADPVEPIKQKEEPAESAPPEKPDENVVPKVFKTFVAGAGLPEGAQWKLVDGHKVVLHVPASATPCRLQVRFTGVELVQGLDELAVHLEVENALASDAKLPDVVAMTKGGPARWEEEITTKGSIGKTKGAYVVDKLK